MKFSKTDAIINRYFLYCLPLRLRTLTQVTRPTTLSFRHSDELAEEESFTVTGYILTKYKLG